MTSINEELRIIFPVVSVKSSTGVIYKIPPEGHVFTLQTILDRGLYTTDERIIERFGKQLLKYPYDRTLIVNPEDINSGIITKSSDTPVTDEYILDNYIYYKIDTGLRYKKREIHMLVHAKMFKDDIANMLEKSDSKYVKSKYDEMEESKKQSLKELERELKEREELLNKREETFNSKEELLKQQEDLLKQQEDLINKKTDKLKDDEESFKKTITEFKILMQVNKLTDPPERPKSSFKFFCEELSPKIMRANPNLNMEKTTKILVQLWGESSGKDKLEYDKKAEDDKERYKKDMIEYDSLSDQYKIQQGLNILRERISEMWDRDDKFNKRDDELTNREDELNKREEELNEKIYTRLGIKW